MNQKLSLFSHIVLQHGLAINISIEYFQGFPPNFTEMTNNPQQAEIGR
jgi:hypothetical protein